MTADEIRKVHKDRVDENSPENIPYATLEVLSEIAIQLAELNELLRNVADAVLPLKR